MTDLLKGLNTPWKEQEMEPNNFFYQKDGSNLANQKRGGWLVYGHSEIELAYAIDFGHNKTRVSNPQKKCLLWTWLKL